MNTNKKWIDEYHDFVISAYILNCSGTGSNGCRAGKVFEDRTEFDAKIFEVSSENEQERLWENIQKVLRIALVNEDDLVVICTDRHNFTEFYTREYLLENILNSSKKGVDILIGGVESFGELVPLDENLMWVDSFETSQFLIFFERVFEKILHTDFDGNKTVSELLTESTSYKVIMYPFISRNVKLGKQAVFTENRFKKVIEICKKHL